MAQDVKTCLSCKSDQHPGASKCHRCGADLNKMSKLLGVLLSPRRMKHG